MTSKVEMSRNPGRPKGRPKTGGRQRGTPNKVTRTVREALTAFVEGNVDKMDELFERIAENDPARALDLLLKASEFAAAKLSRADVTTHSTLNMEVLQAASERVAAGAKVDEIRDMLWAAAPPTFVVTGVPDASPAAAAEIVTRPKSVPVDQHAHWNTPVPPPLRLPGQAPSAASAEPPRLHTPHVTDADFDPYPN